MKLVFWGAAQTVTGSMHLLEYAGRKVLMDCGLYQGRRSEAKRFNSEFPAPPDQIDAVLLSHAHIDHSGLLPKLWREGFRGSVYATHATKDLCATMLADSAHIQEKDADWVNRREKRRGADKVEPLYGKVDAAAVVEAFESVDYGVPFSPLPGSKWCTGTRDTSSVPRRWFSRSRRTGGRSRSASPGTWVATIDRSSVTPSRWTTATT